MTEKETLEGDNLIADFMEFKWAKAWHPKNSREIGFEWQLKIDNPLYFKVECTKYLYFHSSWDWLMPAIRKGKASKNSAAWDWTRLNAYLLICEIKEVFEEFVQFIKWYNKQEK